MSYNWPRIQLLRQEGRTWSEIKKALPIDVSPGTLRKAYSRWLGNAKDAPGVAAPDTPASPAARSRDSGPRILGFDIETAPNEAYVWGIWKQNISLSQIVRTSRVLCFAARWFSDADPRTFFRSEHADGHEEMVRAAWDMLDDADVVVHYNGDRFDVPTLNREFLKYGLMPPSPYQQVDLLKTARRQFRFTSNKLDHLLKELGIEGKVRHTGFEMWVDCMKGDPEAWALMEEYNRGDVDRLEDLYRVMLPWITNHPNYALFLDTDRPVCTNCGGTNLHSRGTSKTKTQMYRRFQCQDCGTWNRERFTSVDKDRRRHILTQAVS